MGIAVATRPVEYTVAGEAINLAELTPTDSQVNAVSRSILQTICCHDLEKTYSLADRVQPPKNVIIAAREFCDAVNRCQSLLQGFEHALYQRLKDDWEESGQAVSKNYRDQAWWQAGFAVVSAVCVIAPILMTEGNYTSLPFADASLTDAEAIRTALKSYKTMISAAGSTVVPSFGQAWEKSSQSPLNLLQLANQDSKGQLDQAKQAEEQIKRFIIDLNQAATQVMREARVATSSSH